MAGRTGPSLVGQGNGRAHGSSGHLRSAGSEPNLGSIASRCGTWREPICADPTPAEVGGVPRIWAPGAGHNGPGVAIKDLADLIFSGNLSSSTTFSLTWARKRRTSYLQDFAPCARSPRHHRVRSAGWDDSPSPGSEKEASAWTAPRRGSSQSGGWGVVQPHLLLVSHQQSGTRSVRRSGLARVAQHLSLVA